MKQTLARSPGLALLTSLWLALTAWVLCLVPVSTRPESLLPATHLDLQDSAQEPPPERPIASAMERDSARFQIEVARARAALKKAVGGLGADAWHLAGRQGKGMKIAILDSGFKGYRSALGKVLPREMIARSFRKDGQIESRESQHGILCAEVIHHLAPQAELLIANWEPEQPESFLESVRWARRQGAQILSCSVIMPTWSDGEGGGPIHEALRKALGEGATQAALLFASAGNTALRHWAGPVKETGSSSKDRWHEWVPGEKDNAVRPVGRESVSIELCGRRVAFELLLRDTTLNRDVALSRSAVDEDCASAVVRYMPQPGHRYAVRVRRIKEKSAQEQKGKPPERFHLTVLSGRLQYTTRSGSIPFPGDGPEVVAVGAIDDRGRRHSYSSCGAGAAAPKPDLVATVPFPSEWRPHQPFGGTSAAAPQAAALAALLWSSHPEWSADKVRRGLCQSALRTTPGHSPELGFGLLHLPPPGR
jgi:subtilisin family serine protease